VAGNWDAPPYESWIPAKSALYVIESSKRGGMGAPEAVPFGARAKADAFVARYGGRVVTWDKIPTDYILSGGDAGPPHRPAAADRHPDNQHPDNQHPDNQHKEGTRQ